MISGFLGPAGTIIYGLKNTKLFKTYKTKRKNPFETIYFYKSQHAGHKK